MDLFLVVMVCLLFFIGIVFIIWGVITNLKNNHLIKNCINKCEGTLIKIEEIEIEHYRNNDSLIRDKIKSYVPVYQYYVEGKIYKIEGTNGSGFKIGDIVNINYNPQNPAESYIAGYSFKAYKIIMVLGIIFILMSLILFTLAKLVF